MKRLTILIVVTVALVLSACGGSTTYPTFVQTRFLAGCTSNGGTPTGCRCTLKQIEQHVTLDRFLTFGEQIRNGSPVRPSWLLDAVATCNLH